MEFPSKNRLRGLLVPTALVFALAACNGGGSGGDTTNTVTPPYTGPVTNVGQLSNDQWSKTTVKGTVISVSVNSPPVVKFRLTDGNGTPLVGIGTWTTKSSTATVSTYANISFSLAKLVPGTAGSPSRWVNYIVTNPPTTTANYWSPTKPTTDAQGTLVDNGDGTYQYTFLRDVTKVNTVLDAYAASPGFTGNNVRADLDDVSWQPTYTTRLTIQVGGSARNTGNSSTHDANTADGTDSGVPAITMLNPANIVYDFIPSTGKPVSAADTQREVAATASCNACHTKLGSSFHSNTRTEVRYCVVCHTDQRKYGSAEATFSSGSFSGSTNKIQGHAVGDFPSFIHRLHRGEELVNQNYNYAGIAFNEVRYPQDMRNCANCHSASTTGAQGDNWNAVPSRFACGACHDDVNWTTGANHDGGAQLSDAACAGCHSSSDIKVYHIPVTAPDPANAGLPASLGGVSSNSHTNSSFVAGNTGNLPTGAISVRWVLNSVSVNSSQQPVWNFKIQKTDGTLNADGTPHYVDVVFNAYNASTPDSMMNGFVGGPSLYLAFAVPQDGITAPNDYNGSINVNLHKLWRGGAAAGSSLVGPDSNGYYTATLAGVTVPANATLITGGVGYFYGVVSQPITAGAASNADNLPLTQISGMTGPNTQVLQDQLRYSWNQFQGTAVPYQGGLAVVAKNVWKLASGQTARRPIVTTAKCETCHENLGTFTSSVFHAGQRNDGPTCTFCHNTSKVSSNGWALNIKEMVHALHAGSMRTFPFTYNQSSQYFNIGYPAILNNCEACHVAGSYDFSGVANSAAVSGNKLLWTTTATGTATGSVLTNPANYSASTTYISPWVTSGTNYGLVFQVNTTTANKSYTWNGVSNAVTAAAGGTVEADQSTLVSSPIASSCYACHDTSTAKTHMTSYGASLNVARSSVTTAVAGVNTVAIVQNEQCLLCHGSGKQADIQTVHMNFQ